MSKDAVKENGSNGQGQRKAKEDELVKLFRDTSAYLTPSKATLIKENGFHRMRVDYSTRNTFTFEPSTLTKFFIVKSDSNKINEVTTVVNGIDTSTDLATVYSISGNKWATIRKSGLAATAGDSSGSKPNQVIHLWQKNRLIKSITAEEMEKTHGPIILEKTFAATQWSPNERFLMFVAEAKPAKAQSFFKEVKESETGNASGRGQEYLYKQSWGEALDNIFHTTIQVVDADGQRETQTIEIKGFSLGSPFWINDEEIGFIAWKEEPSKIGLIYCNNRQSYLYRCKIAEGSKPELLFGDGQPECLRCPRLSPDGQNVLVLGSGVFGPHMTASRLIYYNLKEKTSTVLVDVPSKVNGDHENAMTLYIDSLPDNCFSNDGSFIMLQSVHRCRNVLVGVNVNTKELKQMETPLTCPTILAITDDIVVLQNSAPNAYPSLHLAKLVSAAEHLECFKVNKLDNELLSDVDYKLEEIPVKDSPNTMLHSILIGPSAQMDIPLPTVVVPHGGPHSSFMPAFFLSAALYARLGWKTLLINYRGSTGMNESYSGMLCGNIGKMDVDDCITVIEYHVDKGRVDRSNLILNSGSHGGFLVSHLCGQYPDYGFKACIARNPVIDLSVMTGVTDIPDWCHVEIYGLQKDTYSYDTLKTVDFVKSAFEVSPIRYISNVKTPTLVLVGKNDKRVPMCQGLEYYKVLKARGVDCQCYVYDDKHDLAKPMVEADVFVNVVLWTSKYLQ